MVKEKLQIVCQKIISGGQTGVDRGALDACLQNDFKHGGWCPKGRLAEDGIIDTKYKLRETKENKYYSRTYKNVQNADATLIISQHQELKGGTLLTKQLAEQLKKPVLILVCNKTNSEKMIIKLIKFIQNNNVSTLNVAGPRHSEWTKGYQIAFQLIFELIKKIHNCVKSSHN